MKKNKTIGFMMAAVLLVGGTFMGTKALFTDKAEATNNLVITMGNLDINTKEDEWKIITSTDTGTETTQKASDITNVKPGDRFRKKVTVTNNGSLNQKLDIERTGTSADYPKEILVGDTIQLLKGKVLAKDESVNTYIDVVVTPEMLGEFNKEGSQNTGGKPSFDFNKLTQKYEIKATQTNEKPSDLPDEILPETIKGSK
ncbi:TasA family protein [Romboutsia sedimentorum]|uniref:TasA family protein n=1 Tax=Romboutsia sedimentorum TaxID=1368474 RepID=A0ABT7E7Q8_9FIRM|nr:TasA family protein [Romboutsia sedimentorum]MDK2562959.1 TasA family protein [Romboutsia sedimentorum]